MAGRRQVAAAQTLVEVRNNLAETVEQVDAMMGDGSPGQ